ncbi:MAG: hypothetical protein D6743_13775 [Calditrichaeota bacterium]|nr:MAG: hypothetical protein D6743_13775 [Calditrichota bacterium]
MSKPCQTETGSYIGCTLPPDPNLTAEGWQRRYIADARMAREALANYTELGYEVRLEPVNIQHMSDECGSCKELMHRFTVVYTRKK